MKPLNEMLLQPGRYPEPEQLSPEEAHERLRNAVSACDWRKVVAHQQVKEFLAKVERKAR